MASLFDNLDHVLEVLDDKIVRTENGAYISVDDLKELRRQVGEEKVIEAHLPKPKTFHGAKRLAMQDERLQPEAVPPRAPALGGVKSVETLQEEPNAA